MRIEHIRPYLCAGGLVLAAIAGLAGVAKAQPAVLLPVQGAMLAPDPPVVPMAAPPTMQRSLAQRIAAWDAQPVAQRRERRARYQAWRELGAVEQSRLRAVAAELATFDSSRRAALRAQFDALDDRQQHGWRLGIALGAAYPALHPLLGYVPETQRAPLLEMLRAMPAAQLADLSLLAQRTPPAQRQAVRNALLAVSPAQRGVWLRQRLAE